MTTVDHAGRQQASSAAALPTGTLTFLFTDIEGSTRLLAELGERYESLLGRHHQILRAALVEHGGVEVSSAGDALFAVFRSAASAVAAAAAAQRQLAAEEWPEEAPIRVRMGLHTGEGRLGGDNYSGLDVNRAARIAAAGHGGQVLVSDVTRALVAHQLPTGMALVDLGHHRLKDLPAPEHVWQLALDGLADDFPALRSLDARPHNLPLTPTTLVGREEELTRVGELLARSRLLTLTGAGGTGKTRLALAVAHQRLADLADGCYFVGLEDAHDRPAVAAAIASALGVREKVDRDLESGIRAHLGERELLLVLDNFEQVLSAAPLVAELLAAAPRLRIVVTSRELLHLAGEQGFEVPPLRLPDPGRLPPPAALAQYEAVALFIERARAARPDFAVTDDNAPAVAGICARLDGLPLAIELAAARVRLLTPDEILRRLERRLPFLTGGPRDAPDRQRTLRDAIAWSHDLLDASERRLFARLSVFAGGWRLEAGEEVCNPQAELGIGTLDGLASLVDKSLVRAGEATGETRFAMLQVIREYAAEQLEAEPDGGAISGRHAAHVVALVEKAEPELVLTNVRRWQHRLHAEEDNIRAALRWALDSGEADIGLRICGALWRFWLYWARLREARRWLEAVLAMPGAQQPMLARAKALTALGGVLYWQGQGERMAQMYDEALEIYQQQGDDRQQADALMNAAWAATAQRANPLALERVRQALAHYEAAGDQIAVANARAHLTVGPFFVGLGGTLEEVLSATREAIEANRAAGRLHDATDWSGAIAQAYWVAGDPVRAAEYAREALRGFHEMGNIGLYSMVQHAIAAFEFAANGASERVVRLAAAAARSFDELGGQMQLMERFGDPLSEAKSLLGEDEYQRAVAEGRAMSLDDAVAYALQPG